MVVGTSSQARVIKTTTKRSIHSNHGGRLKNNENGDSSTTKTSTLFMLLLVLVIPLLGIYLDRQIQQWEQSILWQQFHVSKIEDFVQDAAFIKRINNYTLWRACDELTANYTRFWYYPGNEPNNVFEEITIQIYKDTPYWDKAVSYEYWCNIMTPNGKEWPWHTDRDDDVLEREEKLVFPLMGAVYYGFNETYEGGDFTMVNSVPYSRGTRVSDADEQCQDDYCITNDHLLKKSQAKRSEILSVSTKFNTLLFANVSHFHKVTKLKSGRRYALAVNANHWKPYDIKQAPSNDGMIQFAKEKSIDLS